MPEASPFSVNPVQLAPLPLDRARVTLPKISRFSRNPAQSVFASADLIPLFYCSLLFLAGIAFAHFVYLRPGLLLAGVAPLGAIAIVAILKCPRLVWPAIAMVWVVLGAWSAETEPQPVPSPSLLRLADGLLRTVEGTVVSAGPLRAETDSETEDPESGQLTQQVDLEVISAEIVTDTTDTIEPLPQADTPRLRILIRWPDATPPNLIRSGIQPGERIRAVVRFLPPESYHDPGVWNRAVWLADQQITATGTLLATQQDGGEPRLIHQAAAQSTFAGFLNSVRNYGARRIQTLPELTSRLPGFLKASPEDAAMLTALLTGDRSYLTRGLRAGFERTGSFHLIVVSGLHLAILAGCVMAGCRRLRLPRLAATALTLSFTLGYALFTGFAIPAQRSFWMIALYLLGRLLFRDRSPLNAIGFATLCLAVASPRSIFDASLQMTVLAVAAIAGVALPLLEQSLQARIRATQNLRQIALDAKLRPRIAQLRVSLRLIAQHLEPAANRWIAWRAFPFAVRSILRLGELLFITLVVELALALPMAMYFHRITVYALPVNLLILPLLGLLVPLAMAMLIAISSWPIMAILPAALCLGVLHLSLAIVRGLGALSFSDFRIPDPSLLQISSAVLLCVAAIQLARATGPIRRAAFIAILFMACSAVAPHGIQHPQNAVLFQVIDVGQGDSLLLITPEGKTLLVDAGGLGIPARTGVRTPSFDVGEEVVSATLWARGIRRLDTVALTHAHQDHMGGMAAILRNFRPRELWVGNNPPVAAYRALLQQAAEQGTRVVSVYSGDSLSLGSLQLRALAPTRDYQPGPEPGNNDSLVLQARYGATSILLEGDAEAPEEHVLLAYADLASIVLKVGHHGSLTSTRPEFLAAVHPSFAVISDGRRNRFGHPRPEILAELQAAHVRTYRTDIAGTACFLLDGRSVTPQPMCAESR